MTMPWLDKLVAVVAVAFPSLLFAQQAALMPAGDVRMGLKRDPGLAAVIADISASQIRSTDSALVSFGTRHAMSDTVSTTRGIGAARRYLYGKLQGYSKACGGCLRVEYDPALMEMRGHPDRPMVNIVNVLAWLPGRDTSLGRQLMAEALKRVEKLAPSQKIKIAAQRRLENFYKSFGFETVSDPYEEDGIMHVDMIREVGERREAQSDG
jgi:hypothetical protein